MNLFIIFVSGLILVNGIPASQRQERDVSHLVSSYLPPAEAKQPPVFKQLPLMPPLSKEYVPPAKGTEEQTKTLPPANEYLPPKAEMKIVTAKPELPANEYLLPIHMGEDISEIPLEPQSNENNEESSSESAEALNVIPQDTAIKDVDGYHYKKPDTVPDLFTPQAEKAAYLPPLENGNVIKNNNNYYRSVRRLF